jgi:hypothetical protein
MASKHGSKPRRDKKYQPRPVKADAAYKAIRDNWRATFTATQVSDEKQAELRERFAQHLDADKQKDWAVDCKTALVLLKNGNGGLDDWNKVTEVLNVALVLCERGFGPEWLDTIVEAQDQIFVVKMCFERTGAWGWSDAANDAINEGIDVYAAQLEVTKQADVLSAFAEVTRRIEQQQVYKEAA